MENRQKDVFTLSIQMICRFEKVKFKSKDVCTQIQTAWSKVNSEMAMYQVIFLNPLQNNKNMFYTGYLERSCHSR